VKLKNNVQRTLRLGGSTIFWKEFKSNGILHVSLKGRFLKVNMTKLFVRSNILDGWLMFTFSNYQQKCLGNLQRCKKQVPVTSKVTDTLCSSID